MVDHPQAMCILSGITVIFAAFVFLMTNYVGRHCKNLKVSFRDFYFGTKKYKKAMENYKKACKEQNHK